MCACGSVGRVHALLGVATTQDKKMWSNISGDKIREGTKAKHCLAYQPLVTSADTAAEEGAGQGPFV